MFIFPFSFLGEGADFDTDADAYFTRCTGITDQSKNAINSLVVGLKTDGIWSHLDFLNMLAFADTDNNSKANTLLNIRQDLFNSQVLNNGITFSQTYGVNIDSDGILTNCYVSTPTPGSELMAKNNQLMFVYKKQLGDDGWDIGMKGPDQNNAIREQSTSMLYEPQGTDETDGVADITGFQGITVIDSDTAYYGYGNSGGMTTSSSFNPNNNEIADADVCIGGRNDKARPPSGLDSLNVDARYMAWGGGEGLSLTEFQNLQTHIQTYMTTMGVQE